jgi:hypothetical protein
MSLVILIVLVALINALAFWQRHIFIYLITAAVDLTFGFYYAFQIDPFTHTAVEGTTTWIVGAVIAVIGIFCLFRVGMKLFGR